MVDETGNFIIIVSILIMAGVLFILFDIPANNDMSDYHLVSQEEVTIKYLDDSLESIRTTDKMGYQYEFKIINNDTVRYFVNEIEIGDVYRCIEYEQTYQKNEEVINKKHWILYLPEDEYIQVMETLNESTKTKTVIVGNKDEKFESIANSGEKKFMMNIGIVLIIVVLIISVIIGIVYAFVAYLNYKKEIASIEYKTTKMNYDLYLKEASLKNGNAIEESGA